MLSIAYRSTAPAMPKKPSKKEELHDAALVLIAKLKMKDKEETRRFFADEIQVLEELKKQLRVLQK